MLALEPGDCWFDAELLEKKSTLGAKFLADHAKTGRLPIRIWLPIAKWAWSPDQKAFGQQQGWYGDGWDVTGTLPDITCMPSIHVPGEYHGWVKNGVLTDPI